jgi:hypothetical protein
MKSVRSALLCSAFATTAMIPLQAFAQEQADACVMLQETATQINFEESGISEDEFAVVIESNDVARCETLLVEVNAALGIEGEVIETEQARVVLSDEVVIEGRAIIDQGPASVEIEEQPTEVVVGISTPDVNVSQGNMDIVVRQNAPRISLEMPQPTITIEQPAPEIIITMPDPTVDVASARPQVEVRQAEPRVQVTVPEPTVELDLYQAEDPENSPGIEITRRQNAEGGVVESEPEVMMTRSEAQVIYEQEDQQEANVTISRTEPSIRFEQAEPELEFAAAGDPQVNWVQSGEPVVRFEGGEAGEEEAGEQEAMSMEEEDFVAPMEMQEGDQDVAEMGGPNVRRQGYEMIDVQQVVATELEGALIFGVRGNEVSEIGALTVSVDQSDAVIVDVGGYMGMEARQIIVPVTDLTILHNAENGDLRAYINASDEQLMSYPDAG